MQTSTLFRSGALSVLDYRCSAAPGDKPYAELFPTHSISYVRKGSFGCRTRGRSHELVPGSLLVGHAGDEYSCTHDHHAGGDECLSFQFAPEIAEAVGGDSRIWRVGCIPPVPNLVVLGELAQSASQGGSDVSVEEVGLILARRFVELLSDRPRPRNDPAPATAAAPLKPPCGSTLTRTNPSVSTPSRAKRDSACFIFCGYSIVCSALHLINICFALGCAAPCVC